MATEKNFGTRKDRGPMLGLAEPIAIAIELIRIKILLTVT
jgi:hypothetical protein